MDITPTSRSPPARLATNILVAFCSPLFLYIASTTNTLPHNITGMIRKLITAIGMSKSSVFIFLPQMNQINCLTSCVQTVFR